MIWGDLKLKKYILLGIGIGIILTNSVYIWYPKKEKDINQIVEKEVQTRLKKIQDMEKRNQEIGLQNSWEQVSQKLQEWDLKLIKKYDKHN